MTQKNRVFGTSLVGGYGVEIKIEADITVLVTYRRSQEELLDNPEISKAIRLVEESAYTREQLLGYDMFWDRVRRDKDMADELREVKEQLKQKDVETARRMKAKGYAIEDIAEITGLTAEEIKAL